MKCPLCKIGEIETEEKYDYKEEKLYLIETCTLCNYCDKIYLHKGVEYDKSS